MRNKKEELTKELTAEQENALRVLGGMQAPTLQEWADELGVAYTTALYYRRILENRGFITNIPGKARTTRLTDKANEYLKEGGA